VRTHLPRVAQDQRLDPDHRRNRQHLIKQLGIGGCHHHRGLAELMRVHIGSVLTSDPFAPRTAKSVDDASNDLRPVDEVRATGRSCAVKKVPVPKFDLGPKQPVGSQRSTD